MKILKSLFVIVVALGIGVNVAAKKSSTSADDLAIKLHLGVTNYLDGLKQDTQTTPKNVQLLFAHMHLDTIINTPNAPKINIKAWLVAHCYLGMMYYYGHGVSQDYAQAFAHFNDVINPIHNAQKNITDV